MEGNVFIKLGRVAGLGGIAFGFIIFAFKGVIDLLLKNTFQLEPQHAYKIILSILLLSFGAAIIGTLAWLIGRQSGRSERIPSSTMSLVVILAVIVFTGVLAFLLDWNIIKPSPNPPYNTDKLALNGENLLNRVNSFTYNASDPGDPGNRYWTRPTNDRWIETKNNSSKRTVFERIGRINVGECDGNLTAKLGEEDLHIFIPDKGCSSMEIKFRRGYKDQWKGLPEMVDVK